MNKGYLLLVLVVAAGAAAWLARDPGALPARPAGLPVAGAAEADPSATGAGQPAPAVLHTWVDRQGVTHYAQQPPAGVPSRRVEVDGARLTPLPPPDAALAVRVREAAAGSDATPAEPLAGAAPGGLHALRRELEQGARKMQATRDAARPDL